MPCQGLYVRSGLSHNHTKHPTSFQPLYRCTESAPSHEIQSFAGSNWHSIPESIREVLLYSRTPEVTWRGFVMYRQHVQGLRGPQGFVRPALHLQRPPLGVSLIACDASKGPATLSALPEDLNGLTVVQLREELGKVGLAKGVCPNHCFPQGIIEVHFPVDTHVPTVGWACRRGMSKFLPSRKAVLGCILVKTPTYQLLRAAGPGGDVFSCTKRTARRISIALRLLHGARVLSCSCIAPCGMLR